jgi:hypothetical protein
LTKQFQQKRIGLGWLLAAAAAILTVLVIPFVGDQPTPRPIETTATETPEITVVVWELSAGRQRGALQTANLFPRPGADAVIEFRVRAQGREDLSARIETPEGSIIWQGAAQKSPELGLYSLRVPAVTLPERDYILFVGELPAFPFTIL